MSCGDYRSRGLWTVLWQVFNYCKVVISCAPLLMDRRFSSRRWRVEQRMTDDGVKVYIWVYMKLHEPNTYLMYGESILVSNTGDSSLANARDYDQVEGRWIVMVIHRHIPDINNVCDARYKTRRSWIHERKNNCSSYVNGHYFSIRRIISLATSQKYNGKKKDSETRSNDQMLRKRRDANRWIRTICFLFLCLISMSTNFSNPQNMSRVFRVHFCYLRRKHKTPGPR